MISDSVVLTEDQILELSRIAQPRFLPAGYMFRARLILMLAEAGSYNSINSDWELPRRPSAVENSAFRRQGWMGWTRLIPDRSRRC
jgi:hypothetical protein